MSLYRRTIAAIRSGNNYYVPVQPTPPWREEDAQRWARWERMSPRPDSLSEVPEPEIPAPEPVPEPIQPAMAEPAPEPEPVPVSLTGTFESLNGLLSQYLACSDHQRTILALWIIHTWCFEVFPITPYLNVTSPENQSGKTVCMKMLSLLSSNSWMPAGGLTAVRLMEHIAQRRPTLLLDDWHTAFRPNEAQSIIGFLNAGSSEETQYSARNAHDDDKDIYCPKAFAGSEALPASLADRSIPIVLQRRRPAEFTLPFYAGIVRSSSAALVEQIQRWLKNDGNYHALFHHAADIALSHLPGFSPRQCECALPLLTIAEMLGGKWPRRTRIALLRIFNLHGNGDSAIGTQLLADIHSFFTQHPDCPKASTAQLLEYLVGLAGRPWQRYHGTKPLTPNGLRALLRKYEIRCASNQRLQDGSRHKGFRRSDFQAAWSRHLSEVVPAQAEVVPDSTEVVPTPAEVVSENTEVVPTNFLSASE